MNSNFRRSVLKSGIAVAVMTLAFASPATILNGQTSSADQLKDQLLTDWWKGDVPDRRAAKSAYKAFQQSDWSDDVAWAYVLNRLEYNQYRDANTAIKKMGEQTGDWDYWYARMWLGIMTDEVDDSLLLMQKVKQLAAKDDSLSDVTKFHIFSRMGRLLGYVEGPANAKATPATLIETIAILTDGLDDEDFTSLQSNRTSITKRYAKLLNEKSTTTAKQVAEKKQNSVTKKAEIAADNVVIDDRSKSANTEIGSLREEGRRAMQELESRASPIRSNLDSIARSLRSIEIDVANRYGHINSLECAAANEPDDYRRRRLLDRALRARADLRFLESDMFNLKSEYHGVASQLDSIEGEMAAVYRQFGGQISSLQSELRQLNGKRKKNARTAKKLDNVKPNSGYVNAMTSRTNHLPTYDPFPASALKQKLLSK